MNSKTVSTAGLLEVLLSPSVEQGQETCFAGLLKAFGVTYVETACSYSLTTRAPTGQGPFPTAPTVPA